jgi:hypothetical protein
MSKHNGRQFAKGKRPKTKLGLPDLDHSKSEVLNSLRSPESNRGYAHAIDEFTQWCCSEPRLSFNKVVVTRYRIYLEDRHLAPGTINGRLSAGMQARAPACRAIIGFRVSGLAVARNPGERSFYDDRLG